LLIVDLPTSFLLAYPNQYAICSAKRVLHNYFFATTHIKNEMFFLVVDLVMLLLFLTIFFSFSLSHDDDDDIIIQRGLLECSAL
jgi:hypothetical protein